MHDFSRIWEPVGILGGSSLPPAALKYMERA
jgi:hypothetical protein